jgi:hypothetical protein
MNYFITSSSKLNKYRIPPPVDIASLYLPSNSFIELLFNESFCYDSYEYRYSEESLGLIPRSALRRLQIYPTAFKYLKQDSAGTNVFNLVDDDLMMLDALLAYRCDSTGVSIIDSTGSFDFFLENDIDKILTEALDFLSLEESVLEGWDSTSKILYTTYDQLSTALSKLIYIYLQLRIYGRVDLYDNATIVAFTEPLSSGERMISDCFEVFVIDQIFKFISNRAPYLVQL